MKTNNVELLVTQRLRFVGMRREDEYVNNGNPRKTKRKETTLYYHALREAAKKITFLMAVLLRSGGGREREHPVS